MTATFKIESLALDGWIDDPSYLGCTESDNRWDSEAEALVTCDEPGLPSV